MILFYPFWTQVYMSHLCMSSKLVIYSFHLPSSVSLTLTHTHILTLHMTSDSCLGLCHSYPLPFYGYQLVTSCVHDLFPKLQDARWEFFCASLKCILILSLTLRVYVEYLSIVSFRSIIIRNSIVYSVRCQFDISYAIVLPIGRKEVMALSRDLRLC